MLRGAIYTAVKNYNLVQNNLSRVASVSLNGLDNFPANFKNNKCYCLYSTSAASLQSPSQTDSSGKDSLTSDEASKILRIVNEVKRSEDLLKYIIPKKRADELLKRKNGGGAELSLEDVISVVGPKNAPKFFCSVLDKPIPVSTNASIYPLVSQDDIQRITNVLSLVISGDRISWALVKRTTHVKTRLDITSFEHLTYPFKPRMHFLTLLHEMKAVASQVPECELCLVEEYPVSVPTPYMFNFHLQMAQAKSTLLGILSSGPNPPLLISVKTIAVARLFNTFVGSEKVSGQNIVDDLLFHKPVEFLTVDDNVIGKYCEADPKVKEGMSQALLLNLAYWKLSKQIKN